MTVDDKKTRPDVKRAGGANAPSAKTSWADVVAASAEEHASEDATVLEASAPKLPEEPEPPPAERESLRAGDVVRHPKFGDCIVHRIDGKPQFVHMARPNEKVRRLSLDIVAFDFLAIEGRSRVFTMRVKKS